MFHDYGLMWGELRSRLEDRVTKDNRDEKEADPESYYLWRVLKMMDNIEYCDA